MTEELIVLMGHHVAGVLQRSRSDRTNLRFDYDDTYRYATQSTPLSLSMPIQTPSHGSDVVSAWLWGLLPDNSAVLSRWARTFQTSATSPFAFLATPIGEDCAGAVRFVTPERLDAALRRDGGVDWLRKEDVAARLRDLRSDATSWLGPDTSGRFSLAGAQAKTALVLSDGRWGVPHGETPTSHILKPAITGLEEHDLNEHLCLTAARTCGLPAATSAVLTFEDERAVVVERFDRLPQPDGSIRRIHQEDVCQALGVPPDRKYQSDGGPSSTQIMTLLDEQVTPADAYQDRLRFADALFFNWLIGGTDAHSKNYALLLSGTQVRLAPLYDISSALPYPGMHIRKLRSAMKLGGTYSLLPGSQNYWTRIATELNLAADTVTARVRQLADRVPDAFADAAAQPSVAELKSDLPFKLTDAVAARAEECTRFLP